jgi:large subunit ribosomal protein L15
MQLHQIKRKNPNKKSVQVGRGGKRGKTSGRGHKGQNARAGTSKRPEMRDIIKKLPKKRGYRFKSFQERPTVVNLDLIEKNFSDGDKVNPVTLLEKSLIEKNKGKLPTVKILSRGDIKKKVVVSDCLFSKSAKDLIEKVGGEVKE